jgi:hypothetical protein
MQQILVLVDERNFVLNYTFQIVFMWGRILYAPFRYPHRNKCGTVMAGQRAGHGMSPKRALTLWKTADHVHAAV